MLVEVVGYWTPEYLASKAEALRAVELPMVVCVDERHARGDFSPRPGILAYRGRVDASVLVAEAERILGGIRREEFAAGPPSTSVRVVDVRPLERRDVPAER